MLYDLIDSIKNYSVLFVGDSIIDEYQYVQPLGKSPKEHIVPCRALHKEWFEGGVFAAAKHLKTFCDHVSVFTGGDVTRKVRMVDQTYMRKVAEVHYPEQRNAIGTLHHSDITVTTDFGHGFMDAGLIETLCYQRAFLAVNAQTNSSNIGFNLITKYPRADYVCIDEPEARLAAADRLSSIEEVILKLASGRFGRMVVTLGKHGAIGWDKDTGFHRCAAFTDKIVDTMGAGDAFFAITAPMAKHGDMDDILKIGNAAGAIKCGIIGHRASVTKEALMEYLAVNA